jgi:hypothetical protein
MQKLSDFFTPSQAKAFLLDQFKLAPITIGKIDDMNDKQLQVFACLASGYTLGEVGRGLPVDIEDVSLNGRVGELINDFSLPIQRPRVEVENDNGNESKRTIYYMNRSDCQLLKCRIQSLQVFKTVKRLSCIAQTKSENNDLCRAIKKRGRVAATVCMITARTDASKTTKRKLNAEITKLITRFKLDEAG